MPDTSGETRASCCAAMLGGARRLLVGAAVLVCAALGVVAAAPAARAEGIPEASAVAAARLAAWADSRGRVVAFPTVLPAPLVAIEPTIRAYRGEATVDWSGEASADTGGPPNIAIRVTARAPRRALRDCAIQGHSIRTRVVGGGVAMTSCRGDVSRYEASRGYGGWTYVASSKYYGEVTGGDMVRLLLGLAPLPAPPGP